MKTTPMLFLLIHLNQTSYTKNTTPQADNNFIVLQNKDKLDVRDRSYIFNVGASGYDL